MSGRGDRVGRDDLVFGYDHAPVDIAIGLHYPKCEQARDAVTIAIERDGLILVYRNCKTG